MDELSPHRWPNLLQITNRIVPDGEVADETAGLAETLATNAPLGVKAAKRVVRASAYDDLVTVFSLGEELTGNLSETDDAREGVDAFFEDREPQFVGR